jgi:hypothetical protein
MLCVFVMRRTDCWFGAAFHRYGNEWMLSQNLQSFVRETNAFTDVVNLQHIYSTDCQDFARCVSPFPISRIRPIRDTSLPHRGLPAEGNALAL